MTDLKAVFWDLDGTIANTEMDCHRVAFNRAFKKLGFSWYWNKNTYGELLAISGGKERINYYCSFTKQKLSEEALITCHILKNKYYSEIISSSKIPFRIGVIRLIDELVNARISQWIVTTSSRHCVDALMTMKFKCRNNPFKGYITSEDVSKKKPDPEAYAQAIKRSNNEKRNILVIEDSLNGLEAANKAGLNCLITKSPWLGNSSIKFNGAVGVLNHLGDSVNHSHNFKGPSLQSKYVNLEYLRKLVNLDST